MLRLIPAPMHRALLPLAHALRHRWRVLHRAPIDGCTIIVRDPSDAILLVRHSYGPDCWALPGGGIGRSEAPEAAARRELAEETGLAAERIVLVEVIDEELSRSPHRCYLFYAICDGLARPDGREVTEARFFAPHSLPEPLGFHARRRLEIWQQWLKTS